MAQIPKCKFCTLLYSGWIPQMSYILFFNPISISDQYPKIDIWSQRQILSILFETRKWLNNFSNQRFYLDFYHKKVYFNLNNENLFIILEYMSQKIMPQKRTFLSRYSLLYLFLDKDFRAEFLILTLLIYR